MKHIHSPIVGWFDFEQIYSEAVKNAKDGSFFIEIGTANGKSAAFMCVEIYNSKKNILFHSVDIFPPENEKYNQEKNARELLSQFDFCTVNKSDSLDFLNSLNDNSIDFIFLDGAHDGETLSKELILAWQKLKVGGTLAGHDYLNDFYPDVKVEVYKFKQAEIIGTSFLIKKT